MFSKETYFWKERVFGRLVIADTPSERSYLYMSLEVIREAYLTSVLSGRTWDVEAFWKTCLTDELSVRPYRKMECFESYRPWPGRSPSFLKCLALLRGFPDSIFSFETGRKAYFYSFFILRADF